MKRPSHERLVALAMKVQSGDREALGELLLALRGVALLVCRAFGVPPRDAEDAIQDCYLAAIRSLGRLGRPRLVEAWFAALCRNTLVSRSRRLTRRKRGGTDGAKVYPAKDRPSGAPDGLVVAQQNELRERLIHEIGSLGLSPRDEQIVLARTGLCPIEFIADDRSLGSLFGISPQQVCNIMRNALSQLRHNLVSTKEILC